MFERTLRIIIIVIAHLCDDLIMVARVSIAWCAKQQQPTLYKHGLFYSIVCVYTLTPIILYVYR